MSPTIGQALTEHAAERSFAALQIFDAVTGAVIVKELEFCRMAVQVSLATMLVDTVHAALEDAEITLNRDGMDGATSIIALAVCGEVMADEVSSDASVLLRFVGTDSLFLGDVLAPA